MSESHPYAIDHDCPEMADLMQLKYIKANGNAELVTSEIETQKAMGLLMTKFPFFAGIPGDPSDMICVKVTFNEVLLTDNTVHFGHEEQIQF